MNSIKRMMRQTVCLVLSVSIVFQPFYPAYAQQITADGSAPVANQPIVTSASNGTPSLNIVAPNGQGVSYNKFTDYNVGAQGLVLNNSTSIGVSRLGGVMLNNPQLGSGPAARLILNEVTSTNPTQMNGVTEVFGAAADVVVANPNGITCHGCGFINTPQATLTTGTPHLDGTGSLTNLSINRGGILIDGAGLDATDGGGKARLLARAIQLNADIQAGEIEVITGRNDFNPATGVTTPKADDGSPKPSFAIDSSAVGGMYARKITLVGTESGVGFKLDGDLAASASDLHLTADGKITVKNATAQRHIRAISASNDIEVKSSVTADGDIDLSAKRIIFNSDAVLYAGGTSLSLRADNTIQNNSGVIVSNGTTYLATDKLINNHGWIFSNDNMTVEGLTTGTRSTLIQNISGAIESLVGNLTLRGDTLDNKSDVTVSTEQTTIGHQFVSGTAPIISHAGISNAVWHQVYNDGSATYVVIPHPDVVNEILATEGIALSQWTPTLWMSHQPDYATFDWSKWTIIVPDEAQDAPAGAQYLFYYNNDVVNGDYVPSSISTINQGNILLDVDNFTNDKSTLSAVNNLTINGITLINTGVELKNSFSTGLSYSNTTTVRGLGWADTIGHATNGPFLKSQVITGDLPANIAAGGTLTGTLSGSVSNLTTPVTAVEDSTFGTGSNTIVRTTSNRNPLSHVYTNPARFTPAPANAATVFETRAPFLNLGSFYGSDYFLNSFSTPFDPNDIPRRLGDAYYDTQYIAQQILDQTGRRNLTGQSVSLKDQMKKLLDNGAAFANNLMLTPGVALTPEQQAMLINDMVWYEKIQYKGETVLAPRLYLASLSQDNFVQGSSRITAGDINLAAANIINVDGTISADNNLRLTAAKNIAVTGGLIQGTDVNLTAGQDIVLMTRTDTTGDGKTVAGTIYGDQLGIIASHDLNITAGNDLAVAGADLSAGNNAALSAGRDLAVTTTTLDHLTDTAGGKSRFTTHGTQHIGSDISAGGNVTLQAGQNATVQGSNISAGQDVTVKAVAGDVTLTTAENEDYARIYKKNGKNLRDDTRATTTHVASTINAGGDVTLQSALGDVTLKAAEVNAGGDINLTANTGKVNLEVAKDTDFAQNIHQKSNAAWQSMANEGHEIEAIRHTVLTGQGQLNIVAANGVTVQYHQTGDVKKDIAQLASAPGLAWMKSLENDPNVDWQGVKTIHREWSEKHEGLSGPASAVIMVAIAVATQGMGASLAGMGANATGASAAMANAGFTSLVSQASLALINNKGNPAAAFSSLMGADTVKSLAASIITAGLTEKLGGTLLNQPDGVVTESIIDDLRQQLISAGVKTGVDTVVTGVKFSDSLKQNLRFSAAALIGSQVSQEIGLAYAKGDMNRTTQLIAHAVTGCAAGVVGTGNCAPAALAQFSGEIASIIHGEININDVSDITHEWAIRNINLSRLSVVFTLKIGPFLVRKNPVIFNVNNWRIRYEENKV